MRLGLLFDYFLDGGGAMGALVAEIWDVIFVEGGSVVSDRFREWRRVVCIIGTFVLVNGRHIAFLFRKLLHELHQWNLQ